MLKEFGCRIARCFCCLLLLVRQEDQIQWLTITVTICGGSRFLIPHSWPDASSMVLGAWSSIMGRGLVGSWCGWFFGCVQSREAVHEFEM